MNPKHLKQVESERQAIAPYNFVELPDKVVPAQPLPKGDRYYSEQQVDNIKIKRQTGRIECTLTTSSPLYIRGGFNPNDFAKFGDKFSENMTEEEGDRHAAFFNHPVTNQPIIPGSSLRGMLRSLVEIVGYGKIEQVSDRQRFFFRAVAAKGDDPLAGEYKKYVNTRNVKAGYLVQQKESWFIQPAKTVNNASFVAVRERDLQSPVSALTAMDKPGYRPQYIPVSFQEIFIKNTRRFTRNVSDNLNTYTYKGVLVTSGNMLESSSNPAMLRRSNHCIVLEADVNAPLLQIDNDAIQDYCSTLTDFQKQEPSFDRQMGILADGRPIFYCEPPKGVSITLFGQSPNFRIPYLSRSNKRAASAVDFIPQAIGKSDIIDLADAIFGFVRNEKPNQSRAGRVLISDAICEKAANDNIWLTGNPHDAITTEILSSPKPTTFQHYLVQTQTKKSQLKHYASQPDKDTVIRGHKLYWHKGESPSIELANSQEGSNNLKTKIKPIKPGVSFTFTIHFENLNDVELGTLLWILNVAGDSNYRLSLGMGKPLGMGAVQINHQLWLSDRQPRYTKLFQEQAWATSENQASADDSDRCMRAFEAYVLKHIGETAQSLKNVPRIQMLLAMLSWSGPAGNKTRYMEIERVSDRTKENEYKNRPVLPTPLQVMEWEDNRKLHNFVPPSPISNSTKSKPIEQPERKHLDRQVRKRGQVEKERSTQPPNRLKPSKI